MKFLMSSISCAVSHDKNFLISASRYSTKVTSLTWKKRRRRYTRRNRIIRRICRFSQMDNVVIIGHDLWSSIIQQHGIVLEADSNIDWWNIGAPMHVVELTAGDLQNHFFTRANRRRAELSMWSRTFTSGGAKQRRKYQ